MWDNNSPTKLYSALPCTSGLLCLNRKGKDGSAEVSGARLRAVFHVAPVNDDLIWLA